MSESMTRTAVVPASMKRMYERLHFSPGLRAGGFLFVSGQVGILPDFSTAEGVAAQIDAALANLRLVLEAGDARLDGVVELTSFHVGDMAEHFEAMGTPVLAAPHRRFVPKEP